MARIEKTVFISYRRTNIPWALAIFHDLAQHGFDAFFDYTGMASGDFEGVILNNIQSRAHFVVLLTPSALERCDDPDDWLRREIEAALDSKRNIVPLMLEGFDFATPAIANQLTGDLARLKRYNAMSVPPEYFDAAMGKLRDKFLNVPLDAVLHPASLQAQKAASRQQDAAAGAPPVAEDELTAQQWFERAVEATDLDDRIKFNSEAIRLNPNFAEAFYNRGNARRDAADLNGAVDDYTHAIRLFPGFALAFTNRALARTALGDLDAAIEDSTQALRLQPDLAIAFNNRGNVRFDKGDVEGALLDFDQAIVLQPGYANAYYNRGRVLYEKGEFDMATRNYDEAIRLEPGYVQCVLQPGSLPLRSGRLRGSPRRLQLLSARSP